MSLSNICQHHLSQDRATIAIQNFGFQSSQNIHIHVFSTRWRYFSSRSSILILLSIVRSSNVISCTLIFNIWILKLLYQANIYLRWQLFEPKVSELCNFFRFSHEIQCSGGTVCAYFNLCNNTFAIYKSNSEIFHHRFLYISCANVGKTDIFSIFLRC